jgi:hypothetical protein
MQQPTSLLWDLRLSQCCSLRLRPSEVWRCMVESDAGESCSFHLHGTFLCYRWKQQMVSYPKNSNLKFEFSVYNDYIMGLASEESWFEPQQGQEIFSSPNCLDWLWGSWMGSGNSFLRGKANEMWRWPFTPL